MFSKTHPIHRLQSEMDRLMESFFGPQVPRGAGGPVANFPPLAVWEDADAYHVEAELPGLALEDISLFVKDREVSISGKLQGTAKGDGVNVLRSERPSGEFARELRLPVPLDPEKVEARLVNGVLTLDLPKAAEAKGRRIEVKSG